MERLELLVDEIPIVNVVALRQLKRQARRVDLVAVNAVLDEVEKHVLFKLVQRNVYAHLQRRHDFVPLFEAADDLLTIQGAYASFVISKIDSHTVNISARSFGKLNVQLIMEGLGGGGHQTVAATQLKDVTLEQAKDKLIDVLKQIEFK